MNSNVPLLLTSRAGELAMASQYDADYSLIHIEEGCTCELQGIMQARVRGELAYYLVLTDGRNTYYYCVNKLTNECMPATAQCAGISLLAKRPLISYGDNVRRLHLTHAFGHQEIKASNNAVKIVVTAFKNRNKKEIRNMLPEWRDNKVTGRHHTLIRPEEVLVCISKDRASLVAKMLTRLLKFTETTAFVAGMLLFAASADAEMVETVVNSSILWAKSEMGYWYESAKTAAEDLKTHHHYTNQPLQQLFELQVLVNRGMGAVSWEDERRNRTEPRIVSLPRGVVFEETKRLLKESFGGGYKYAREDWSQFWNRRWASVPNGSIHSQYEEDNVYVEKEQPKRNKNYTLLKVGDSKLSRWTSRTPEIVGWASEKYEWGKTRAIYGTDITSYLLTDFAMPSAEEALGHKFPVGHKANEDYVAERIKLAGDAGVAFCYDYEDFNSQHSLQSMYEVVDAYFDVFRPYMSEDQKQAAGWVRLSVLKQRINDPTGSYNVRATLLSGWRLTTFVNTILNYVYLKSAGCMTDMLDSIHNGDDALIYVKNVYSAQRVMAKCNAINIRAQPSKCVIAGIEEFLRVDRRAVQKTGAQYLTRAIATAVHARAESNEPDNILALTQSTMTRLSELEKRGAGQALVANLTKTVLGNVERIFKAKAGDTSIILNTHRAQGGLCEDVDAKVEYRIRNAKTMHELDYKEQTLLPGVHDYAKYLIKIFRLDGKMIPKVVDTLAKVTKRLITHVRTGLEVSLVEDKHKAWVAQQLYKVCKDDYMTQAHTGKARLTGLPLGAIPIRGIGGMAQARIACSSDPIETMRLIF